MLKSHQIPLALPVKNTDASCFMLSSHFLWSLNMKICSMIKTSTYPLSSGNIFQTMKGRVVFPGPVGVFRCWGNHMHRTIIPQNKIIIIHNYHILLMKKLKSQGIVIIVLICAAHRLRLAKVHISLHFHPTQLSLYCSLCYIFFMSTTFRKGSFGYWEKPNY